MTTNLGSTGAPFNTNIPEYIDNADIQAALRIYHYGSNTQNPTRDQNGDLPLSIAKHFEDLTNNKVSITQTLGASVDLNSYVTTGSFNQSDTLQARAGQNYPLYNSNAYSGLLEVFAEDNGAIAYQTYHMSDSINRKFWRVGTKSGAVWTWGAWQTFTDQVTGSASTVMTQSLAASRVLISGAGQKIEASPITTSELGTLQDSLTSTTIQAQLNRKSTVKNNSGQVAGHSTFVQQNEPNSTNNPGYTPQAGDLWFW